MAQITFSDHVHESLIVLQSLLDQAATVEHITAVVREAVCERARTLFTCGNGGSAADALHLAEELVCRYRCNRRPLASVCLNADPTALTCIANDFGYEQVFARQLTGIARAGDILVCFSTSGTSPNILEALRAARACGVVSVALLGKDGGEARLLADHVLVVASYNTARIQEAHTLLLHAICEEIETHMQAQ